MTKQADQIIEMLRAGHDDLDTVVARFRPEDLARGSAAAEWTVAQVLSHLGSGAEINLATLEGALAGTGVPGGEFNQATWDRWNAMSPGEQAAGFLTANEKLVQRYEGLDDRQRQELRIDFGYLPKPVEVAAAAEMRLSELTLHSWDVRVAFDSSAVLAPEPTGTLLDGIGRLLGWVGKADQLDGAARIAVHTVEPERAFGLVIDDKVHLTEVPESADGTLTAPAEYVVRLVTGRHAAEFTPASVEFTSETLTLDNLRRVFPGF
ncbi:maleylpyruvate isomerase family mycothiol-dependent enzyme [Kribbella sancticallisti]|uniref:Maleylpyruvate isomerase family mycothiol-dependent enzyme n=1 Tax=Kribbella sancticallisti TaxID=460087 RepID=A0ABP4PQW7_9ACTN